MARSASVPPLVLSVGGSVLSTDDAHAGYWTRLADLLRDVGKERRLLVTTGGGHVARDYIRLGRQVGLTEVELDELGIDVTRIHARLLSALVGPGAPDHPPTTVGQAVHELERFSPVVLGGTEPGHTTDAVAALVAVRVRAARVVNATRVDGVYERDPTLDPSAKRYTTLTWPQFQKIVERGSPGTAGQEFVFDRPGTETLARARIPLRVVGGLDLRNLRAALLTERFRGTEVH